MPFDDDVRDTLPNRPRAIVIYDPSGTPVYRIEVPPLPEENDDDERT